MRGENTMAIIRMTPEEIKNSFTKEMGDKELEEALRQPIIPDDDCPEITPELIGKRFIRVDRHKRKPAI